MSLHDFVGWPGGLPLLLLAPAVVIAARRIEQSRARRLLAAVGPRLDRLAAELRPGARRRRGLLAGAGLLLALVALLEPRWGNARRSVAPRGVDLVVALDVSQSMLADDLPPSRLARAQQALRELADRARGDRLGLIAFAGEARQIVPLTQDLDSFTRWVDPADPLHPLDIVRGGSDLGAALELALSALQARSGDHEAVILLSDGEDLAGEGGAIAERCRERNITVHCIGFGSARGGKIAVEGPQGAAFLRDRTGQEVITALDAGSLRKIAAITGGEYLEAADHEQPLVELYEERILAMARQSFEARTRDEESSRFQWPLLVAFLLWIVEFAWPDRRAA